MSNSIDNPEGLLNEPASQKGLLEHLGAVTLEEALADLSELDESVAVFLRCAADMTTPASVLGDHCAAFLRATTSIPEGAIRNCNGRFRVSTSGDPCAQRAELICRLGCDAALGVCAQTSYDDAAAILRATLCSAAQACRDFELAFLYLDEELTRAESIQVSVVEVAKNDKVQDWEGRIAVANSALEAQAQILQRAGLRDEGYVPRMASMWLGKVGARAKVAKRQPVNSQLFWLGSPPQNQVQ